MGKKTDGYEKIKKLIEELEKEYYTAYSTFITWKELNKLCDKSRVGEGPAEKNLESLNSINFFYNTAFYAIQDSMILRISKFFDTDDKTRSLIYLLKTFEKNKTNLKINNLSEIYDDSELVDDLVFEINNFDSYDSETLKKKRKDEPLKSILHYRSKYAAHSDLTRPSISIPIEDIENILEYIEECLSKLSNTILSTHTIRPRLDWDHTTSVKKFFKYLEFGRKYEDIYKNIKADIKIEEVDKMIEKNLKNHAKL